jgi:hypothetical protein
MNRYSTASAKNRVLGRLTASQMIADAVEVDTQTQPSAHAIRLP